MRQSLLHFGSAALQFGINHPWIGCPFK